MRHNWQLHAGRILGAACGAAAGGCTGAAIGSWTEALVGTYGGFVGGTTMGSGLARSVAGADDEQRRAGIAGLGYGAGAVLGALLGLWLGTMGIDRLPPMAGFFAGLALGSLVVGLAVARLVRVEMLPPALPGLLTTAGAGGGAWLGTVLGHPVAVAGWLVIGSAAGLSLTLLLFRALERAVADYVDHGGAGYDERRGNRL
ncbi:hypothetical protein ACIGW1_31755 [Streptomyces sp. NPDC053780]|uniref:hypothetical protein n=1 Tax=unclassified Streptomyces TaxID=2593676 RepID=UPI000F7418C7|nr:hypothetical protein [Streptomyces sp. WAC 04229]RSN61960.1 hypothetical protein DMH12_06465 [Streptomyces sp. WAC 04229]